MTNYKKAQESGRSMVEMLGVLAIIGVLSIAGIAGYTTSMNKYKANEILNGASVRAMYISSKLQLDSTNTNLSIAEFTDKPAGITMTTGTRTATDTTFKIQLSPTPDANICAQMIATAGKDGIIRDWGNGDNCAELTFNNDLAIDPIASNYKTKESCEATEVGKYWCIDHCVNSSADCNSNCSSHEFVGSNDQGGSARCVSCDESVAIYTTSTECDQCSNRYWNSTNSTCRLG